MINEEFVKYLRNLRGIQTQKEFAEKLSVSLSLYTKVETGVKEPSKKFLVTLKRYDPKVDMNVFFR